jgi:hypothetical protein
MLKRIALAALFAITFTVGAGAASARNLTKHAPTAPAPQGFCPYMGMC